jgi:hypothetical protein
VTPATSVPDEIDRRWNVAQQRERDADGELRHRPRHRPRRIHDSDAAFGGLVQVDPVQPIVERPGNDPKVGRTIQAFHVERRDRVRAWSHGAMTTACDPGKRSSSDLVSSSRAASGGHAR